jgi:branched-chain amino acid aminotransferase
MTVWLNGALLPPGMARIDPADRGLLLGDGLFETMAAQNGAVPELARHYVRLCAGAKLLRLPVPLDLAPLAAAIGAVLAANGMGSGRRQRAVAAGRFPSDPPADRGRIAAAERPAASSCQHDPARPGFAAQRH